MLMARDYKARQRRIALIEVILDEAHGLKDVERLYILLKPWQAQKYRLLIVGRKKLPDPDEHNRFWTFVWRVFKDREALNGELGEKEYTTRTRGLRRVAAVRPAGEGIYSIVRHHDHTHLAYVLELPQQEGPAERELGIEFKADAETEHSSDVFRVLNLPREVAREPLFRGQWK
jgi:hypothetical protein